MGMMLIKKLLQPTAAKNAGVKRVVLFSTIAVYGASDGCVLNEMSPTHPDTFYALTKRAAEQIVLNARGADGQPLGAVLRLGAVYGSRIKGNYERLTHALERHRFIPIALPWVVSRLDCHCLWGQRAL